MSRARAAAVVAALLAVFGPLAAPARADLVPPGMHPVEHTLVFDDAPSFRQWRLCAFPVRGFGGVEVVQPGVPFRFSGKYGTRLYACRPDAALPEDAEALRAWLAANAAAVDIPVEEVRNVPLVSTLESVRTRLRFVGVEQGALQVEVVDEERSHDPLVLSVWLVGAAAASAAAWWLLRRRSGRD